MGRHLALSNFKIFFEEQTMHSDRYENTFGFTLMELSIALLIFLIGLLGLLQLMTVGISLNQRSRDTTLVTSLAQGKADELLSKNFTALTAGGVIPTNPASDPLTPAPDTCFVDYFNYDGNSLVASDDCGTSTPPDGTYFVRSWQISD